SGVSVGSVVLAVSGVSVGWVVLAVSGVSVGSVVLAVSGVSVGSVVLAVSVVSAASFVCAASVLFCSFVAGVPADDINPSPKPVRAASLIYAGSPRQVPVRYSEFTARNRCANLVATSS